MAERTMEELLRAPTEGYGEAIVLPEINADHFEIKTNLLQLVQANPFYGRESENPHAHINSFKRITSTLRFRNKSKVRYFRNRSNASRMNVTSSKTDERIDKLADQLSTLVEIVSKKVVTPAPVYRRTRSSLLASIGRCQISPSIALAPVSSIMEPEDSLIMGNEELSTIPEKESDEFIKSSVEDLIPIPRESEDASGSDSESVLPSSDDFSPIFEEKSVTFSNPLFDSNDDFTSSDDESLSDEDVPEENVKIYSNPLFEFDDEYISSDVNPLFDEVLEDIECEDSYDSNLDESTFLVTPLSDSNEDECLAPRDDIELLLHHDPSISIVSILEGFIDEPPLEENDDLFDLESKENDWKKILYDAPIDDLITEDKVFDPGIYEKSFSPTFVKLTFEDRHYFPITFVIRIFLPYLTYSMDSPFLLSSGSEDTIFDPSIFTFHFSSLKPVAYENPMVIFPFFCFCLKDKGIRGEEGIVLGHKISKSGIEVDHAKVDVIAKLPHPTTVKGVRSFLGHAGFYRRFIQDFSKIARPMTHLLKKETPFVFSKDCIDAFQTLKKKLTEAPILVVPDWNLPFELMCDASDFAIGAVLGQRKMKHFQPIHYASKTMTEAQIHYTTTEKEMLAVVYAFEKFRPYLVLSKASVYGTLALKYLMTNRR
ncbi:gag-pol polyprotein [Tanacetum coccineum]